MRRVGAIVAGLLGLLTAPLALSSGTAWLALLAHGLLATTCATLSIVDGLAGRPLAARGWGAWFLVATAGLAAALHVASWDAGGWGWAPMIAIVTMWSAFPPVVAWGAGALGARRQRGRTRREVRRRHAALGR